MIKNIAIVILLIGLGLFGFGWYRSATTVPSTTESATTTQSTTQTTPTLPTFTLGNKKISLQIPSPLHAEQKGNQIAITHGVPYTHPDGCDMRGDGKMLNTLTDVSMTVSIVPGPLSTAVKKYFGSYFIEHQLKGETLVTSEGYVEIYNLPNRSGYRVSESVEGCGQTTYLFPQADNTYTLVIKDALIPELSGVISSADLAKYIALPGVIVPERAEELKKQVLGSITIQ